MFQISNSALKDPNSKNHDPQIMDLQMFENHVSALKDYCKDRGFQFEQIYNDFSNREESEDWKLEMEVHDTESPDLIKDYYSKTRMYLYELSLQECRWDYKELFYSIAEFAKERKIKRALDFGGGIGGLSIYLNSRGTQCDYADIPGNTWDYAGYRLKKEGIKCSQLSRDDLEDKKNSYDLIVSLDCLEHLKPLSDYISLFSSLLKKDGILLVKSAFYGEGLHLESNYKYNNLKTFNKLTEKNNFDFKGQLITRMKRNFLLPEIVLQMLNKKTSSGRKLIYRKAE